MMAASKENHEVTLPEGVSLRRVAEVLLDAWAADPRRSADAPRSNCAKNCWRWSNGMLSQMPRPNWKKSRPNARNGRQIFTAGQCNNKMR
ncbi:MAG: hypothetical protein KGJ88_10960 [Verrucomicrobiota bacterium]|nr:hypothetical protein [Verrucomicrobiota bacterium]